jgi:hypothetical protein
MLQQNNFPSLKHVWPRQGEMMHFYPKLKSHLFQTTSEKLRLQISYLRSLAGKEMHFYSLIIQGDEHVQSEVFIILL